MQTSSFWSAFCICSSKSGLVAGYIMGSVWLHTTSLRGIVYRISQIRSPCLYLNFFFLAKNTTQKVAMIKEADICGETIIIDLANTPLWKVVAINLLFLTYGTFANRKLTFLRNHIERDNCCGPTQ